MNVPIRSVNHSKIRLSAPLLAIALVWLAGTVLILDAATPEDLIVAHWANGHMMDSPSLLPGFAEVFNARNVETESGKRIQVRLYRANSGQISGEIKARWLHSAAIDRDKPDPTLVTPAAEHWVNDVNQSLGAPVLDVPGSKAIATTYIGIVTSREMAQCLGWPQRETGFADIVNLATSPHGWTNYACARPDWGQEATIAFTYPSRSSTARSVLFGLYSIAAHKPAEQLTLADVNRSDVAQYVKGFQTAIDCYVPDTLDLNLKILSTPSCAQFYFIAEDNLVKLYQGKIDVPSNSPSIGEHLERDLVMIYPKEGSIVHNHSAILVQADFVEADQEEAAKKWTDFLRQDSQQRALMQEGFRPTTDTPCIDPLGSPFTQCAIRTLNVIYPDRIDPEAAAAILKAWD